MKQKNGLMGTMKQNEAMDVQRKLKNKKTGDVEGIAAAVLLLLMMMI